MTVTNDSKPLTTKRIESLKSKSDVYRISDFPVTGLKISITKSGSKKWVFAFTDPISNKRMIWTFGDFPAVTLADARTRAIQYRQCVNDGKNPRNLDRQTRQEAKRQSELGTVEQLITIYIDDLKRDGKITWKHYQARFNRLVIPVIGDIPAKEIDLDIAVGLLAKIGEDVSEIVMNQVRINLCTVWKLGLSIRANPRWHGKVAAFDLSQNPFALIPAPPNVSNATERCLNKEELQLFWNNIHAATKSQIALATQFLFSIGQRIEEVRSAKWCEIDLDTELWVIPWQRRKSRHKIKIDHVVPLSPLHITLLEQIKVLSNGSEYVFPHLYDNDRPITAGTMHHGTRNLCASSVWQGKEAFTPKASRKVFKTLGVQHVGLSREIRDKIQGHSDSSIGAKHYDRYDYLSEKREAMDAWCKWLKDEIIGH